jgi:putative hydroxymethylpyrimidine transport system permease protein
MFRLALRISLVSIGLIALWESLILFLQLPAYILPPPLHVLHSLFAHKSLIIEHAQATLIEIIFGLASGIVVGGIIALMMSLFRSVHSFFLPLLLISQALPIFAIAPLFVLWFGYGIAVKIASITLMLFFPIAHNFLEGLNKTPQHFLDMAQLLGANRWKTLYHIRIPAALPALASGIRLATVLAPLGAVISEWIGTSRGLGFLLINSNAQLQIDLMFAVIAILILLATMIYFFVDSFLAWVIPWNTKT